MALLPLTRDLGPLLLLVLTAFLWKKHFYMRGLTYRSSVVPLDRERLLKSIFYLGFLGTLDTFLRRSGQLFAHFARVFPSESSALAFRLCLLHLPWALWAYRGPLSDAGSTRDDRGWSDAVTRSGLWRFVARRFGTRIVLSEEWRQLSPEQRGKWYDRHYVTGTHQGGRRGGAQWWVTLWGKVGPKMSRIKGEKHGKIIEKPKLSLWEVTIGCLNTSMSVC
eukprot:Skav206261  [mRNA]  locus=scaffold265:136271:136933:- [translate_table: standard]